MLYRFKNSKMQQVVYRSLAPTSWAMQARDVVKRTNRKHSPFLRYLWIIKIVVSNEKKYGNAQKDKAEQI